MKSILLRIALPVGLLLVAALGLSAWITWSQLQDDVAASMRGYAGGLSRMLVAALQESMKNNDRAHLRETIHDFGELAWVSRIRIIDKHGVVAFASDPSETGVVISREAETCRSCHRAEPVPTERASVRRLPSRSDRVLQAATTIHVEPACTKCHESPVGAVLGVLVLDLDMTPLMHDVRQRAARNLTILVAASALLLVLLAFVVRSVVVKPLHGLSNVLAAIRTGGRLPVERGSPQDEIDDLKETLEALGADLEGRQLAAIVTRQLEIELCGYRQSFILLDPQGGIVLANDQAQLSLGQDHAALVGRSYPELDAARRDLWRRAEDASVAFHPEAKADRSPDGADLVLLVMRQADGTALGFVEVGKLAAPAAEPAEPEAARPPWFPTQLMHSPYRTASEAEDSHLRAVLLLSMLDRKQLAGGVFDLDRTFARAMKTLTRLVRLREVLDERATVCDVARVARGVVGDFRRVGKSEVDFHCLLDDAVPLVGHPVLLRQLVVVLVEEAVAAARSDVVVFLHRRQDQPRFFFGVWADGTYVPERTPSRWALVRELASRLDGCLELDPRYDIGELAAAFPGRVPALGGGCLFVMDLPHSLG